MLDKLRNYFSSTSGAKSDAEVLPVFDATDRQLCEAALMFHVIAADGIVDEEEKKRLIQVLEKSHGLSEIEAQQLMEEARLADMEAIDLYAFTSKLKRLLPHEERLVLIENLWKMVFADGVIHELEDNVVWRVAELLSIEKRDRMEIKRKVRRQLEQSQTDKAG